MRFLERLRRFFEREPGAPAIRSRPAEPENAPEGSTRHEKLYHGALRRYESGDSDGALEMLQEAIHLKPDAAESHLLIARIHERLGRIEDALDHYILATHYGPRQPEAWLGVGRVAAHGGSLDAARDHLERAVALNPDAAWAHNALGALRYRMHEVEAARAHFQRAVELEPDCADAHSNLGYVLFRDLERLDDGTRHIQAALELAPDNETALVNWAMVLQHRGDWQAALELCDRLLLKNPGLHEVRCNRGLILLTRGDFRRGWLDYEARRHLPEFPRRDRTSPEWQGSSLAGKSVLVYGEQGLGDQIMFASCLPDVARTARSCLIECHPKLERLLSRSFPQARVSATKSPASGTEKGALPDGVDWQVAMGSLPLHFRAEWRDFPRHEGYLKAHPARVDFWKSRLQQLGGMLSIGIAWRGGAPSTRRSLRSVPLAEWAPMLACKAARFVSLQHDARMEELETECGRNDFVIHHWPEAIDDYDETAALVSALDLVITVQTAVAHLSGALGKATWVLIPAIPEWRYLDHGERMPWYPQMRLFRQPAPHDWQPVIGRLRGELEQMIAA